MSVRSTRGRNALPWAGGFLLLSGVWAALQLAAGGQSLFVPFAQGRPALAGEFDAAAEKSVPPEDEEGATVRLNFFNSTWPDVLRKVAEETDSELVMKRAPSGRWTRFDRTQYSRTDAVRLLNREIEPKGFRLLEQGRFLVVLHLDNLRTRYERPEIPRGDTAETEAAETTPARRKDRFVSSAIRVDDETRASTSSSFSSPASASPARRPAEVAVEPAVRPGVPPRELSPPSHHAPAVVPTRRQGAKAVAEAVYRALNDRALLVHDGPGHLPAFEVYRTPRGSAADGDWPPRADSGDLQFAVGIDTNREQLVVAAPRVRQQQIVQMIRTIDAAETGPDQTVRLVASEEDVRQMAQRLRPALRLMVAQNQVGHAGAFGFQQQQQPDDAPPEDDDPPRTQPGRPDDGNEPPPQAPGVPPGDQPLLEVEGLRGPVSIHDVPGVGMIITGNPQDVEAVVRLMRELERLATGTIPQVEVLRLRHVNSTALAGLLSTVYEQLTNVRGTAQRSRAAIIPVVKPNALLVIASDADLNAIASLTERLDEPVDPRSEFQVFALKNAVAAQVVETLNSLYGDQQPQQQQQQQAETLGPGLGVLMRAVADVRTNSVIVQAAPRDLAEIALLIRKIDRDTAASVNRMKVFPLKNAVADELAEIINTAIQSVLTPAQTTGGAGGGGQFQGGGAAGQSTQQLRDAKSVVLEFLTTEGTARRIIRSGILSDIRVTADPRVNSVIVTAPEQSMSLMAELIRQLDQPTSTVAEIKVFTLANSDAAAMAQLLETLFATDDDDNQIGVQLAGAEDASSGLIPLRFSVDVRTNSIIGIGGAEALRVVEAILLRLDETDVRQRKTIVIKLKNSPAQSVADAINQFLQSQRDLAQIDPELVSNVELLEQEIIVVPELVSNSLLVSATPRYYEEVLRIIEKLDEAPAQVIIQTLIVEVDLQNTDEFGVELGFQDSLLFDRGLLNLENFETITQTITSPNGVQTTTEQIVNQERVPGFLFNNQQLGNNTAVRPASVGTQGLSNFSLGRVNGDLGFGGLVLSASSESVSVLVRALASQRNLHVLSRPQIRTVDNQLAQIQVGQQVPVITGATTNALGGITPTLGAPQQVGIILQVTPRITPDGIIVMETIANKSSFAGQGVPILTDPTTGAVVESPIFDLTEARATIAVPDGQTVVLGGMITKTDDTIERKVPWLGDIPILGTAFRYDSTASRRTELIIFMTPRIIRNPADSELIKQVESERLHFLEEVAEEVHGPLYAVPPEAPTSVYPGLLPVSPEGYPILPEGFPPPDGFVVPPAQDGLIYDEQGIPTTIMPGQPGPEMKMPPAPSGAVPPTYVPPAHVSPETPPAYVPPPSRPNMSSRSGAGSASVAGRQTVRSGGNGVDGNIVRGSQPKRQGLLSRLPFGSK